MLANRSIPSCTVIPVLVYPDVAKAVDWLCEAFGFAVRLRIGNHRVQLQVGDGAVMVGEDMTGLFSAPDAGLALSREQNALTILVRVEDAHAHHKRASEFGARILRAPLDFPYGERQYTAADLAGYRWTFSQSIADVGPDEWMGTRGPIQSR